jgi:PAS domain S-box-containing protein
MIQHVRKPKRFEEEVRIKHAKGHYIWAKVRGQVISDKKSQATRIVGSVEDFTEIKTINQTTENLMQGIEASDIAFAIINYDHQKNLFTYASQAFCDLMGCSFEEVLQRNFNMFTGPETDMGSLDMIDYAFKNGNDLTLKIYSYRIDGTGFWNEIILRPIRDKNTNEIYTYIVVFNDLTTSILQEKKEISRQRVESLGALAGSVAHEINNLLMPMTMAKDMLEDSLKEDCDPFAIEQLDIMVDYANQAKEIVEGILTFSRKDTKNIEAAFLYNEIEKSITFIKGLISSKVIIIWETGDNQELKNIQTLINTTELKQIVTNLCRNAEDAMNGKSGIITLSMSHQTLSVEERDNLEVIASDFAVLKVEDDGSGIPNEKLEKIFEPLYTTKDVGQGTGLGLSIVMGILRSWGGAITVKSKLGKGTTFKLYIPIHKMSDNYDDLADFAESVDFINPDFTRD